ncbi:hypothetical protein ACQUY5_26890 [Bacillus cereus]|uniref:hypothetical protein n=1 Tax=Bacillus cereus TaxID=1396 RepID=UPI003D16AAD8
MQTVLFILLTLLSLIVCVLNLHCLKRPVEEIREGQGDDSVEEKKLVISVVSLLGLCRITSFVAETVEQSSKILGYYIIISLIMSVMIISNLKLRDRNKTVANLIPIISLLVVFYFAKGLFETMFTVWKSVTDIPFPYINFISWWWR